MLAELTNTLLTGRYTEADIARVLLPRHAYHPYPTGEEHAAWESLPDAIRAREIAYGEEALEFGWPPLLATQFMDFMRTGNRQRFEACYFARRGALGKLVTAECIEGEGRFLDQIINGIWTLCEESSWVLPAHCYGYPIHRICALPEPTYVYLDLFAAETGALLSWVHYLIAPRLDAIEPSISARLRHEITQRIITPFLEHTDYWWLGMSHDGWVNNWTPWCTSNCLSAVLLMEEDPARRAQAVNKALWCLDRFLGGYHADGGCDEGPSYWNQAGASLFDCLELLYSASDGAINVYDEPLVKEIGRYIQRVRISGEYFINFADAGALVSIPGDLVYRYGRRIGDAQLAAFGATVAPAQEQAVAPWYAFFRKFSALFTAKEIETADTNAGCIRDTWLDGIQLMAAREQTDDHGLYLAAKGGHNNESHNHNDIGQFIVYVDGRPILNDVGVETYTLKTFSAQRYDIWTMQSGYHNLPTINGVQQAPGAEYTARDVSYVADETHAELSLDIAAAYPPDAGIITWQRICRLQRGEQAAVEIIDAFRLAQPTADITMSLMTPCAPRLAEPGLIILSEAVAGDVRVSYDPTLTATVERIDINDDRLRPAWGDHLFRIILAATTPVEQGRWVLRVTR